jgi:phosphoribosylanthranilate isomerase
VSLRIKICGLQDSANITGVASLNPDYMGFIFYKKSPRYAGALNPGVLDTLPSGICKTGVFVDEATRTVFDTAKRYQLDTIQLHGTESPAECTSYRRHGLKVIKAVSISSKEDLQASDAYANCCDYLLFDTKTPLHGGSGKQYDWSLLDHYHGELPFFLSGGISFDDTDRILAFSHPRLYAVDINSRFEISPGIKDIETLARFVSLVNNHR